MKAKLLNLGLIVSSLIGYLEWAGDNHMFLFQGEIDVVGKLFTDPASVAHPFTILPLVGQLLLLFTLFQKKPNRLLTIVGLGSIGVLLATVLLVGILALNIKIIASITPFILISYLVVRQFRRETLAQQ